MASAMLMSCNESNWCKSDGLYMAGALIPNSDPSLMRSNPSNHQLKGRCFDQSQVVARSCPDDASSMSEKTRRLRFEQRDYVTLSVVSCSKKEAAVLRNRLINELERVRNLRARIDRGEFTQKKDSPDMSTAVRELKRRVTMSPNFTKLCSQILGKLMKHKNSWVFNTPVDVVSMNLHDYYDIVKNPMDLGTVKSNLLKKLYSSPEEFEADVLLTFDNAMLYNPKGHEVHSMAEQFLALFLDLFRPAYMNYSNKRRINVPDEDAQGSCYHQNEQEPLSERIEPALSASNPPQSPTPASSPVMIPPANTSGGKLPKPKARDMDKRDMSLDEKQRLGAALQILPPEKATQVVQIVRKRNGHLTDDGDEIELDMEAMDAETLWELDRLVTNWKKMVSRSRRQSLITTGTADDSQIIKKPESEFDRKKSAVEEDIDIGDEVPSSSFPPVEIEIDDGAGSSSSSTSGSSSSGSSSSGVSDSFSLSLSEPTSIKVGILQIPTPEVPLAPIPPI